MRSSLTKKLCCPIDKHSLEINILTQTEEDEILEALMFCPECQRQYPVIYGIPILIPDEYRDRKLEEPILQEWNANLELQDTEQPQLTSPDHK